jgi:catechol 2,3-dioxygenase-like lactoylglutathione lyase family enzyme
MLTISGVASLVIYSSDLARSREFYEKTLDLRLKNSTAYSTTYAAGEVDLEVRSAQHDNTLLAGGRDDTCLIVFHVDDIEKMRQSLEVRGVKFEPTLRYEIGATAAFYDPDGHNITLYEPSEEAMTWPSASKIRAITAAGKRGEALRDRPVVYLFLFIRKAKEAYEFYRNELGLRVLEEDPEAGVVKYDGETLIFATHVVGGDAKCAVDMDLGRAKGVAATFNVSDIDATCRELAVLKIDFAGRPAEVNAGPGAFFKDPNGHPFLLKQAVSAHNGDAAVTVPLRAKGGAQKAF